MRRVVGVFVVLALIAAPALAQDIIENGKKPENPRAGRTVALEEILRITDEGGEFFFRHPYSLRVDPDGAVFVQEQQQLYHFDKDGRFVRDYFKKGQGPGELNYVSGFIPTGEHLIVCGIMPGKIIWFGYDGQVVREFSIRSPVLMFQLFHFDGEAHYFSGSASPFENLEKFVPAEVAVPQTIYKLKKGESEFVPLGSYSIQAYVIPGKGGGGGMFNLSSLNLALLGSDSVALSHTPEYLVKILSLKDNRVLRAFRRDYDRVKPPPQEEQKGGVIIDGKHYAAAPQKYVADITAVHADAGRIWVVTSTKDKAGRPQIDVFDPDGRWLDSFYLELPKGIAATALTTRASALRDGFLYLISTGEESTSILKCRLRDPAGQP